MSIKQVFELLLIVGTSVTNHGQAGSPWCIGICRVGSAWGWHAEGGNTITSTCHDFEHCRTRGQQQREYSLLILRFVLTWIWKGHGTNDTPIHHALAAIHIPQTNESGEEGFETSGHGRCKRAPRDIGALNGCLCGVVVNPGVDVNWNEPKVECRQPGCETRWVCSRVPDCDLCYSHVLQYHLQCIGLEQAPTKWICESCEASGRTLVKCHRKWCHITIYRIVPDYIVS